MLRFWFARLRQIPRLLYKSLTTVAGWISLISTTLLLFNESLYEYLGGDGGVSRWWAMLPIGLLTIWEALKDYYEDYVSLEAQLEEARRPTTRLEVVFPETGRAHDPPYRNSEVAGATHFRIGVVNRGGVRAENVTASLHRVESVDTGEALRGKYPVKLEALPDPRPSQTLPPGNEVLFEVFSVDVARGKFGELARDRLGKRAAEVHGLDLGDFRPEGMGPALRIVESVELCKSA